MADSSKRKRKIARDFIFEVGENEVSPVNSPNPNIDRNSECSIKSPKAPKLEETNSNCEVNLDASKENINQETNSNDLKCETKNDSSIVNTDVTDGSEQSVCILQGGILNDLKETNEACNVMKDNGSNKAIEVVEQHVNEVSVDNIQPNRLDQKESNKENISCKETDIIEITKTVTEVDGAKNSRCDFIVIEENRYESKQSLNWTSNEILSDERTEKKSANENTVTQKHLNDDALSNICLKSEEDNSDNVLITVHFKNKFIGELFKGKILDALTKLQEFNVTDKVDTDNEIVLSPKFDPDLNVLDENDLAKYKKKKKKHPKKVKDDMFVLDTKPSYNKYENVQPQYSSKFSIEKTAVADDNQEVKSGPLCFNCSEKHPLRDCPHPKNFVRINKAKLKMKKVRYHVEEDQKYADLKPGKISFLLREALGLRNNELPAYIYRMRALGYPPGWVEEAFESQSELSLFDSNGKMVGANKKNEWKVNADKIFEYAGFNAPMDKYMKDEYDYYKCQRYSKHINKDTIIEAIKKLKDNFETCDMDIDNEPEDDVAPPGCEIEIKNLQNQRDSPSLTELERQKLELLAELDESELKTVENINKKVIETEVTTECSNQEELKLLIDDDDSSPLNKSNIVKESSFGTPVFKREFSIYKLPHIDKFSINMTPIINFENLPNSTGTYEKMAGILEKVRKKLKDETESNL